MDRSEKRQLLVDVLRVVWKTRKPKNQAGQISFRKRKILRTTNLVFSRRNRCQMGSVELFRWFMGKRRKPIRHRPRQRGSPCLGNRFQTSTPPYPHPTRARNLRPSHRMGSIRRNTHPLGNREKQTHFTDPPTNSQPISPPAFPSQTILVANNHPSARPNRSFLHLETLREIF